MSAASIKPSIASAFLEFVREAQRLIARPPATVPVEAFRHFVELAVPLVVADIKCHLPALGRRAALASRWLVRDDLLAVAGFGFVEDAYTELMAWALHPDTDPDSAVDRQRAWLRAVGLDDEICGERHCVPQPQLVTEDGIPDLVLRYDHVTVVVEAKTGSAEHNAPSKKRQTIAYPEAVRRRLELRAETRVEIVFLTPNRRSAANAEAKLTTYADFAFAMAEALDARQLRPETRAAYAMLVTHLLTCATPATTVPARTLVERVNGWAAAADWDNDVQIRARRDELLEAMEILVPEHSPMGNAFKTFDKATRLYAAYVAVVDEVYDAYVSDLKAFADTLRDRLRLLVGEGQFTEETAKANKRYRSWYIWDPADKSEVISSLWMDTHDPRLVVPGELHLTVETDEENEPRRRQVAALEHGSQLPEGCRVVRGDKGDLVTVAITYGDADPVEATVKPVLALLTLLYEIDQKTKPVAISKKRGRP